MSAGDMPPMGPVGVVMAPSDMRAATRQVLAIPGRSPRAMPLVACFTTGARSSASHCWRISSGDNSRSRGGSVLIGRGMLHVGST